VRDQGTAEQKAILSPWPTPRPQDWLTRVNEPITAKERDAWRTSLERSRPFGDDQWIVRSSRQLGLEHTIRREGRPVEAKGDDAKAN
jgi:putative transposase